MAVVGVAPVAAFAVATVAPMSPVFGLLVILGVVSFLLTLFRYEGVLS